MKSNCVYSFRSFCHRFSGGDAKLPGRNGAGNKGNNNNNNHNNNSQPDSPASFIIIDTSHLEYF